MYVCQMKLQLAVVFTNVYQDDVRNEYQIFKLAESTSLRLHWLPAILCIIRKDIKELTL